VPDHIVVAADEVLIAVRAADRRLADDHEAELVGDIELEAGARRRL
jgi:hypothetical protein